MSIPGSCLLYCI